MSEIVETSFSITGLNRSNVSVLHTANLLFVSALRFSNYFESGIFISNKIYQPFPKGLQYYGILQQFKFSY